MKLKRPIILIAVFVLLIFTTTALATSFVCDMPPASYGITYYVITGNPSVPSVAALTTGMYGFNYNLTGTNPPYQGTVKACNSFGCLPEVPFGPPVSAPGGFRIIP